VRAVPTAPACDRDAIRSALDELAKADRAGDDPENRRALERALGEAATTLSASTDAAHLHAAALLTDDAATALSLLARALVINPDDPFLQLSAVQACRRAAQDVDCPLAAWQARLLELDRDNSVAWGEIAVSRYAAGEPGTAMDALRHGAAAPHTRQHWSDTVLLIERGLEAGSNLAFSDRVRTAFAIAAGRAGPSFNAIDRMCALRGDDSTAWAYACLSYAENFEAGSRTVMGRMIMLGLQARALRAIGDLDALDAVTRRQQDTDAAFTAATTTRDPLAEQLVTADPRIFARYLATLKTDGEIAAMAYATAEASRWRDDRTLAACAH
jgi:hypothetical protein